MTCAIATSLLIRPFTPQDADAVLLIRKRNLEKEDSVDYPKEKIQKMITDLTAENLIELSKETRRVFLVAVDGSEIRGSVGLYDDNVKLMFVDPDYQRQGIGSQLLARIEQVAKDRGIFKLSLMASIPAEAFYQKFGYVKTGEEVNHMGRVILMSKELSH